MNPVVTQWIKVAVIVGSYVVGSLLQKRHVDRFRESINKRFDDLHDLLKLEVKRLEERFDRVEERLERLEHPSVRQS